MLIRVRAKLCGTADLQGQIWRTLFYILSDALEGYAWEFKTLVFNFGGITILF